MSGWKVELSSMQPCCKPPKGFLKLHSRDFGRLYVYYWWPVWLLLWLPYKLWRLWLRAKMYSWALTQYKANVDAAYAGRLAGQEDMRKALRVSMALSDVTIGGELKEVLPQRCSDDEMERFLLLASSGPGMPRVVMAAFWAGHARGRAEVKAEKRL